MINAAHLKLEDALSQLVPYLSSMDEAGLEKLGKTD
jgi:hypothetical protein